MIWWIVSPVVILFLIGFIKGFTAREEKETDDKKELEEINKQERIQLLENTLVQYTKLLDNLAAQYNVETDEKRKAVILRQQIATLEKYNKALEKIEKLDS